LQPHALKTKIEREGKLSAFKLNETLFIFFQINIGSITSDVPEEKLYRMHQCLQQNWNMAIGIRA